MSDKKKFYQTKEFIKLQKKWYKKLDRSGFEDLEWFNEKNGLGQGSPFLKSKNVPDTGTIRKKYTKSLQQHYRLCRNFRQHGDFYSILRTKYRNSSDLQRNFPSFKKFLESLESYYTKAQEKLWELYSEGITYKEITDELRRLHRRKRLGKPPKRWGKAHRGEPYSIFWVKKQIDKLKVDMIVFNRTHAEGLLLDDEADGDFDIAANTPSI